MVSENGDPQNEIIVYDRDSLAVEQSVAFGANGYMLLYRAYPDVLNVFPTSDGVVVLEMCPINNPSIDFVFDPSSNREVCRYLHLNRCAFASALAIASRKAMELRGEPGAVVLDSCRTVLQDSKEDIQMRRFNRPTLRNGLMVSESGFEVFCNTKVDEGCDAINAERYKPSFYMYIPKI